MRIETKYLAFVYAIVVIAIVAGLIWFRFIWLTTQSVKAFTSTAASFQASHIHSSSLPAPLGKPLVVHFIDRECPCTRYSVPYIDKLLQETNESAEHLMSEDISSLDSENLASITEVLSAVPASPAVAIWNHDGNLSYFGPYSTGAYCGDGEDMVRYTLQKMAQKSPIKWVDQEALGCLCPWQHQA